MLVNPYHIAHKNRDVLKEFAMEAKITNNNLPANQHDTDTSKLDNLYSLIEKLTSTIQEQTSTIQEQTSTIQEQTSTIQKQTSTIQKQTEAFQNQAKKVEEQENRISELLDLLKKADSELSDSKKLVKTLKTLLSSKEVDLDALRRLLFQGGREQKKDKKEAASQNAEEKQTQHHVNSLHRNRQSNSAKADCCDGEKERFFDFNGNALEASARDDASKEIAQTIEKDGKTYVFKGWKKDSAKIEQVRTSIRVLSYVPVYEEAMPAQNDETPAVIVGINPEKDFLPKTVFGFSFAAQTIAERMRNRIPLNRIAQEISNSLGFNVSRQQLARYSAFSAEWILPAYEYLKASVLKSRIIHLDETFISCQAEKGSRQYMLVFVSEKGCFYCYTNTRSQSVPFKIMEEQFGDGKWLSKDGDSIIISTDGWYDVEWLKNPDGTYKAKLVGCLVHLRRYFYDIYGAHQNHIDKESEEYQVSKRVVELIGEVFHRDSECSTIEERTKLRKSDDFRQYFEEIGKLTEKHFKIISESESPKGIYTEKFIKAVKYSHNQWEKFTRILEDGSIPLDNSAAERAIRDFAVLRHAMPSGFGSIEGAKSTAVFSSFHETCKVHGIDLEDYLEFLFRYMGIHRDELKDESLSDERRNAILEQAMPWKFKKA